MAIVEFGNVSADMRVVDDAYAISGLQNFDAFLTSFIPVREEVLQDTPTSYSSRLYDAGNQFVTISATGALDLGQVNFVSIEAAGVVEAIQGSFTVDAMGNVSGTAAEVRADFVQGGGLIARFSGLAVPVFISDATPPDLPSDDVLFAGPDTLGAGNGNDYLLGYDGDDSLSGGAGNDTLDGGTGIDTLAGGTGDDTCVIDSGVDFVIENSGEGIDTIQVASTFLPSSYALPANVENLTLLGSADKIGIGNNGLAHLMIGNSGNNVLDSAGGDDTLIGGLGNDSLYGGAGADLLYGGAGDDTFTVDGQADLVFENPGEGTDTVIASASFYLYAGIEKLVLASGAGDIFGSANELDNTLTGNEGVNLLLGWDGADTISGGTGNDILYGVNDPDVLYGEDGIDVLVGGGGNDTLDGGTQADLLAGEDGDDLLTGGTDFATDILIGGAGNDTLDGASANGDYDLMDGSAGDDTYRVDTPDDLTFEAEDGGRDAVIANISGAGYYLYPNVENITLIGQTPYGVGNDLNNVLTGSEQANWLLGGGGDDTINGKGGYDVLFGQDGADTFVFERGTGGDVIGDFTPGTDKLQLAGIGYTNVTEVKAHMVEAGGVSAIDLGAGDFVVLHNVTIASLSEGDLIFA